MKGIAYMIMFTFIMLGLFGLMYVVFNEVYVNNIYSWGQANIIDTNQTTYQGYYKMAWDGLPVVVTFGAMIFLLVWAQKRGVDDYA